MMHGNMKNAIDYTWPDVNVNITLNFILLSNISEIKTPKIYLNNVIDDRFILSLISKQVVWNAKYLHLNEVLILGN